MSEPAAKQSDPNAAESWVDEIVARNQESLDRQRIAAAPRRVRSSLPYLVAATIVLLGLSIWNPGRRHAPIEAQTSLQTNAAQFLSLEVGIQIVEAYRDSTGRLPATLADATHLPLGLEYTPHASGTYRLASGPDGDRVVYRSDGPRPDLARVIGPLFEEVMP